MTVRDPTLAFTAVLAPVRRFTTSSPPLPERIEALFGPRESVALDPIESILHGPIARRRLAAASGPGGGRALLQGLGDALAVTVVAERSGEHEREPTAELHAAALAPFVYGFSGDGESPSEVSADELAASLSSDPRWRLLGFVEVTTTLVEGIAEDVDSAAGWGATGTVQIGRGRGVGAGHAAWGVRGYFTRDSELSVVRRRLTTLREGFAAKVAPTVEYGAAALRWGLSSRRALGQAGALDDLVESLRASVSESIAQGESPEPGLAARLEHLRAGLVEEIETLKALRPRLTESSGRVFGDSTEDAEGPFPEGGDAGARVLTALADRDASAARWAGVLRAAAAV